MAKCFTVHVVTAEGTVLEGEAEYVRFETADGSLGVLADHAPMLCALREGEISFRMEDGQNKILQISGGVADVRNNNVTVLADSAKLKE